MRGCEFGGITSFLWSPMLLRVTTIIASPQRHGAERVVVAGLVTLAAGLATLSLADAMSKAPTATSAIADEFTAALELRRRDGKRSPPIDRDVIRRSGRGVRDPWRAQSPASVLPTWRR